jgi:4-amino-4-deoxy-L-arabinose transferase-like glycosyltransferase
MVPLLAGWIAKDSRQMHPVNPQDLNFSAALPFDNALERSRLRRLTVALFLLSILFAGLHCWLGRHSMNPDGVTYMDISDAYRKGQWKDALNSYRSPLYSWMLTPALAITQDRPDSEFAAVHAVNFLIFLATLFCFHFLLTGVIRTHPQSVFPDWAFMVAAYAVFLWSTLVVITLELVTPDLCVAAAVYAATGVLLRVRKRDDRWVLFFVLGIILGIGYLAKAALLAFAPLMVILCAVAIGKARLAVPRAMVVAVGFAIVAVPWIYALSQAKGRFTLGDAGTLAYGFMVQEVPMLHWHGGPPGSGMPAHPDRQVYSHPDVYEFAHPISGTYPPSYDYSYWAEGMTVKPRFWTHMRRVAKSLREYATFFDEQLSGLMSVVLLLWLIGERRVSSVRLVCEWRLLIPVCYGLGLYAQVWVDWRYLGAHVTLFWISFLCALWIPDSTWRRHVTGAAAVAIMFVLGFHIYSFSYTKIRQNDPMEPHMEVARSLRRLQVGPGSPVASIGDANMAFWARLARVRIVVEIPYDVWDPALRAPETTDVEYFWGLSAVERATVMQKLAATGARVVVVRDVPPGPAGLGWQRIAGTAYSVRRL